MGMRTVLTGLAGMLLGSMMPVQADMPRPTGLAADIRWTAYGVPHIRAKDERGLGYGIGYAYARDNACLLAEEIVTARGERARYFGSEGKSSAELDNLPSDIFYAWLNQPEALQAFWQAQTPAVRQLLEGYAAGFNRFLREADGKTTSCLGQPWLRAIATDDLLRLTRRLLVEGGVGQFADALVAAAPPGTEKVALSGEQAFQVAEQRRQRFRLERGSNAIAVGSERSADGKGMLLANPHFPWNGAMRFYQMHLTIPGRLDVMGASLPGLPVVNIGFSRHLAWTHTVDTSSHFTLYRLALDPKDPRRYLVDGRSLPLEEKSVAIEVRGADGKLSRVEHKVYQSIYGPLVVWPGKLDWNRSEAYALRDANLENTRVLQQWYSINQASDVADLRRRVEALQGIPWVNTLAADEQGNALYMNQSVAPYLKPELIPACAIPQLVAEGLPALQGQDSRCAWSRDPAAAQAGITPAAQLPVLLRRDFVQNSNDSAWLTNPASPLQGFSPLVSQEKPIGPRARYALSRLQGKQPLEAKTLEEMVTANHVFSADQVLPDLLRLCRDNQGEKSLCPRLRGPGAVGPWRQPRQRQRFRLLPALHATLRRTRRRVEGTVRCATSPGYAARHRPRPAAGGDPGAPGAGGRGGGGGEERDSRRRALGRPASEHPWPGTHRDSRRRWPFRGLQRDPERPQGRPPGGGRRHQLHPTGDLPRGRAQGSRVAGFLPVQRSALAALPRPDRAVFPPAMADLAVQRQADRRRPATATAKHSRMISNAYQI